MKAHVEPSCQSLFGLWLSPWVYTWSYSEISAERSQAFWKCLYLYYMESYHVHDFICFPICSKLELFISNLPCRNTALLRLAAAILFLCVLQHLSMIHRTSDDRRPDRTHRRLMFFMYNVTLVCNSYVCLNNN